ncbi:hypothetical protein [Shewanella dokdonensis]|uniref:Uncharacterized protein n=1 Tax=Shewanella dokdonensis TaxID=712036 RepID=A0ABX8DCD2_9GAMM|nr:hypothetical protein [Shewanella dokdonensis]MCL1074559.1 hypothetical protein [Shewanella dokdonensis]QVK22420.1 hypothetical protein KHX94_13690 [Shewanella dokdonensis]
MRNINNYMLCGYLFFVVLLLLPIDGGFRALGVIIVNIVLFAIYYFINRGDKSDN